MRLRVALALLRANQIAGNIINFKMNIYNIEAAGAAAPVAQTVREQQGAAGCPFFTRTTLRLLFTRLEIEIFFVGI
jgi:hypothetical protein